MKNLVMGASPKKRVFAYKHQNYRLLRCIACVTRGRFRWRLSRCNRVVIWGRMGAGQGVSRLQIGWRRSVQKQSRIPLRNRSPCPIIDRAIDPCLRGNVVIVTPVLHTAHRQPPRFNRRQSRCTHAEPHGVHLFRDHLTKHYKPTTRPTAYSRPTDFLKLHIMTKSIINIPFWQHRIHHPSR